MLDVSRHFLEVEQVNRHFGRIALYELNRLRLHLSVDQGWRIAVDFWPRPARHGGSSEVGGSYTQADYREIVEYARPSPQVPWPGGS